MRERERRKNDFDTPNGSRGVYTVAAAVAAMTTTRDDTGLSTGD